MSRNLQATLEEAIQNWIDNLTEDELDAIDIYWPNNTSEIMASAAIIAFDACVAGQREYKENQ